MKSAKTPGRNGIAGTLGRLQPRWQRDLRLTDVRQVGAELVLSGEGHPCLPATGDIAATLRRMQCIWRISRAHLVNLGDGPDRGVGRCRWTSLVQSCACCASRLPWAGAGGNHLGRRIAVPQNQRSSRRLRAAPERSQSSRSRSGRREGCCGLCERTEELLVHEAPEQRERRALVIAHALLPPAGSGSVAHRALLEPEPVVDRRVPPDPVTKLLRCDTHNHFEYQTSCHKRVFGPGD